MAQRRGQAKARAVAASGRHREPAGGQDHTAGFERAAGGLECPAVAGGPETGDRRAELKAHAVTMCQGDKPVAHIARTVGAREQFAGLFLEGERNADLVLEERLLLA